MTILIELPIETIDKIFDKDVLLKDFVNSVVKEYEGSTCTCEKGSFKEKNSTKGNPGCQPEFF